MIYPDRLGFLRVSHPGLGIPKLVLTGLVLTGLGLTGLGIA